MARVFTRGAESEVLPRYVFLEPLLAGARVLEVDAVALTSGKGKVVLLGFRAQHRAQTPATFPFVFNALYWSTAK